MDHPDPSPSITLVGTPYWLGVAEALFRRAGIRVAQVSDTPRWLGLSWVLSRAFRRARVIHMVWGGHVVVSIAARLLGKTLVWHWIGTDVLGLRQRKGWVARLRRWIARRCVRAHLADSPELARELEVSGIHAEVCRLLPASIESEAMPLPEAFRVLSYWNDERMAFYGGRTILEVARRMPDVEFLIVGATGAGVTAPGNVRFLGQVSNLDPIYEKTSVFLRLPEHDSLSAMVLEALARGRFVVCNRDFPHCLRAETVDQVWTALRRLADAKAPNHDGAVFVQERFSLDREADGLRRLYARLGLDR